MEQKEERKENLLVNLGVNILIPVLILSKYSSEEYLGPVYGLVAAIAFPLGYGLYDLIRYKKKNIISLLGLINVLLTGVIGLLEFPPQYVAIKEAMIPFIIGIVILASTKTSFPLVKKILFNKEILNVQEIEARLQAQDKRPAFEKALNRASVFLALSFFFSAVLNFILAKMVVVSNPGTTAFNEELGTMTTLSYPVIAIPSTILLLLIFYNLMKSIRKLTGLDKNEVLAEKLRG